VHSVSVAVLHCASRLLMHTITCFMRALLVPVLVGFTLRADVLAPYCVALTMCVLSNCYCRLAQYLTSRHVLQLYESEHTVRYDNIALAQVSCCYVTCHTAAAATAVSPAATATTQLLVAILVMLAA
jgi:hypothetical protein